MTVAPQIKIRAAQQHTLPFQRELYVMSEGDAGGQYHCRSCRRYHESTAPEAHDCPVSNAEHNAVAWLGYAGLYRTRMEAVRNGEQSLSPVSADELFEHASRYLYLTRTLRMRLKAPSARVTKTPAETDTITDAHVQRHMKSWHA